MTPSILTPGWGIRIADQAGADPAYLGAGRAFTGSILLFDEASALTLRCDRGKVVEILDHEDPRGAEFRLGGPIASWHGALHVARDLGAATDKNVGGLTLTGDYVALAGNAKVLMRLWIAMITVTANEPANSRV